MTIEMPYDTASECPVCGTPVAPERAEIRDFDDRMVRAVVVVPGSFWPHLRDEHPAEFAEAVGRRRMTNAAPFIVAMPRRVDGAILRPGEDVASLGS